MSSLAQGVDKIDAKQNICTILKVIAVFGRHGHNIVRSVQIILHQNNIINLK